MALNEANKYITKLYHLGKEYIFDERVSTTGINVSPTSINLTKLNQTAQITASVIPTNADDKKIIYTSSAPSIVSVSSTGLVKALGEGNATITVKSNEGGFSKSVSVIVYSGINVSSYKLSNEASSSGCVNGITISPTGDKLYLAEFPQNSTPHIRQYEMSTPYDISSINRASSSSYISKTTTGYDNYSCLSPCIKEGGGHMYVLRPVSSGSSQYTVVQDFTISGYSISSRTLSKSYSIQNRIFYSIQFNETGTKAYLMGTAKALEEYSLSTPWDISTMASTGTSVAIYGNTAYISKKGDQLIVNTDAGKLKQYKLTTPWDITTSTLEKDVKVGDYGVFFALSDDTSKLYFTRATTYTQYIYEYTSQ